MGRMLMPLLLTFAFVVWCVYHIVIKKDFAKQKNNFYLGLFFIAVWALIYYLFFTS
jgi:hypothetical protein